MKPYYDHNGITIYHGDCLEIMPELEPVDLVLTDPPYGINYIARKLGENEKRARRTKYEGQEIIGDTIKFNPGKFLIAKEHIFWGANNYCDVLPISSGWIIWDKKKDPRFYGKTTFSDCELAWTDIGNRALIYRQIWNGIVREGEPARRGNGRYHPNQKPERLMKWCINLSKPGGIIFDPFMGSGTTLVAAKELGRKAIGIEIEEKYCEIAVRRLAQEVLPFGSNQSFEKDG